MAEHYKFSRKMCDRKRFILRIFFYDIYALVSGFGIFLIFYFAQGAMNKKGQMYDVATYGIIGTVCVVYLHHIQVLVHVRNIAAINVRCSTSQIVGLARMAR